MNPKIDNTKTIQVFSYLSKIIVILLSKRIINNKRSLQKLSLTIVFIFIILSISDISFL